MHSSSTNKSEQKRYVGSRLSIDFLIFFFCTKYATVFLVVIVAIYACSIQATTTKKLPTKQWSYIFLVFFEREKKGNNMKRQEWQKEEAGRLPNRRDFEFIFSRAVIFPAVSLPLAEKAQFI